MPGSAPSSGSASACPRPCRRRSSAHALNPTYTSRLPLAVYLAGAATTVALSFVFVLVRDVRADRPAHDRRRATCRRALCASDCAVLGLVAWTWIVAQGIAGGTSAGRSRRLFLWVYGWVGVALVSRAIGPAGTSSTRSRPLRRRRRRSGASASRLDARRLPGPAGQVARRRRFLASSGWSSWRRRRALDAVHRARRLHGVDPRDDGPVRPRYVARERRDVHASGSGSSVASPRTRLADEAAVSAADRSSAACSSPAG